VKIKNNPQYGVLESQEIVVYEYSFDGHFCKFRKVNPDASFSKWMEPDFMSNERRD